MPAPSDPEKYSIDEMMARLKSRNSDTAIENGELVTRADGSQAIRVRKKKRRTHQPAKQKNWYQLNTHILQVSGALILLLLAFFCASFAIVFANSTPFRESLIRKIAVSTGASVDLQQFRMNPTSANATALTLTWPSGNVLGNLSLRGLDADISPISFLGKSMVGQETHFSEATLSLRIPTANQPSRDTPSADGEPQIIFNQYTIPKFHLIVGDPTSPHLQLSNGEATFLAENPKGRPELLLTRGNIAITGWPNLRMDRAHIEFRGAETDIIGMHLKHETDSKGVLDLSGTITPKDTEHASTLGVHLESYLLSGIVGPDLGRFIAGRIDTVSSSTSNYLSFTPGPEPAPSLSVTFSNSLTTSIQVTSIPFLFGLSQSLDDDWFNHPLFDTEISGLLRRADGTVTIENFHFEHKDRMALKGTISISNDKKLAGQLEVGVFEGIIKLSKNRRLDAMFGPSKNGFRWITVNLGGSSATPTDNFKELYDSAANRTSAEATATTPSFEELTRPK